MKFTKEWKTLCILLLAVLIINLFFLTKAYHMDDISFVYIAQQVAQDPLKPYSFTYEAISQTGIATHITDPPLPSYYYALFILLFGGGEIVLHTAFLLFTFLSLIGMYFIAKQYTKRAYLCMLLLFVTPIFFVLSHNVMVDVPFLAFFLLAIIFYSKGIDTAKTNFLWYGALFTSLAILTKYTGLLLIPLLMAYAFFRKKYLPMIVFILPIMVLLAWNAWTASIYGGGHVSQIATYIFENTQGFSPLPYLIRTIITLSSIGGGILFPFFLILPFLPKRKYAIAYITFLLLSIAAAIGLSSLSQDFVSGTYSFGELILFVVFFSGALEMIFIVFDYCYNDVKLFFLSFIHKQSPAFDAKLLFLFIWFVGILLFNIVVISDSTRFILLLLPPFLIFYVLSLATMSYSKNTRSAIVYSALFLTFVLSLLLAINDYQLADAYRTFAQEETEKYTATGTLWFAGHHGFQYYMEQSGSTVVGLQSNEPNVRDTIARSALMAPRPFTPELAQRIEKRSELQYQSKIPLRLFNVEAHAGFYSHGAGFLPYAISTAKLDSIAIYEVVE